MSKEVPPIQGFHTDRPGDIDDAGPPNSLFVGYRVLHMPSTGVVRDEVAQDSHEVRHRFASAGIAALDGAQRDARLRHLVGLAHQLGEPPSMYVTRPPQADRCADRGLDVVIAERHRCAPHALFDLDLEARRSLTLPPTHPPTIHVGAGRSPALTAPTQRLRAPDIQRQF